MSTPTPQPQTPEAAPAGAEGHVSVLTARGVREQRKAGSIRNYDFRQSGFLTPSELRRIRLRHEQFVRSLAARLAIFLRLEYTVQLDKLQIIGYQKFSESLPNPTAITLFKTDPLKGVGLLVMPLRLGLGLVDRLLGGPGKLPEAGREMSEIEVALLNQAATLVLGEWCAHWPEMRDLRPALLGHETNSKFLQTATADTAMLVLTINIGVGEQTEPMQIAFPYATLEPLVRLLCPAGLPEHTSVTTRPSRPKWNAEFNEVAVPVIVEWQGLKLSAGDIAHLKQGDVLMLDPKCAAQVQLRFNQVPKFLGRPGTRAGNWAVELTGALTT